MNYYRLWIYTCNAVLFISVLGFVIVAGKVVIVDPRRTLIPGLTLHEPSLLYAYLALFTQSGVLQLLGCIGALKLNEKLLNMYWILLLFLLFGDAFIGIVWIFRFDKMYTDLKPLLKQRLQAEYGVNEEFTNIWDSIQRDFQCCGVEGPQDFNDIDLTQRNAKKSNDSVERTNFRSEQIGCEVKLKKWLRDSAHVLGVLGYCVIAFLKLCFLGILRYEIKEMIQKIKMLQGELQPPILLLSAETPNENPEINSPTSPHICNHLDNSILTSTSGKHQNPIESGMTQQNHRLFNNILTNDTGNDSDTNSHCALLIDGDDIPPKKQHNRMSSNGNNNFESHELQDLLLRNSAQI
ncbi:UNVERIFIED_CONTAM: hypothetical protein PYX00_002303 [Menopon gallinae]|uniref:Tetraspanin n=1 Tax=Menopon gallinae TaxID=328185 RepID=A0AAW2IGT7_9NEOP